MTNLPLLETATEKALEQNKVFLAAEWRDLLMLNYAVNPQLLAPYVPAGTAIDSFHGVTYLSLVGFRFCRTRLLGHFAIPLHSNFDEVNLRFYVRRDVSGESRRGVVFIAEVVPRFAILWRELPVRSHAASHRNQWADEGD